MEHGVSTSTIGREEARKPLMAAYMFQRRMLFFCSGLFVLSLIMWIVAISTDHWIIISGGGGIFIPETRRFFMSSHSGLWRQCRFTIMPNALSNANVIRNFTSIGYTNPTLLNEAKMNASNMDFIKEFLQEDVQFPLENFTEPALRRMFAHWVRNEEAVFQSFKNEFNNSVLSKPEVRREIDAVQAVPIAVDPLEITSVEEHNVFGKALQKVQINSTWYHFVIPETVQLAIFDGWQSKKYVPKLLWPYVRDLDIPAYVLNENRIVLQLVPPSPPRKGKQAHGYDYVSSRRCKYIDMFVSDGPSTDLGFDSTVMDYIRTQASFACITVFVMGLGAVFSFYTFMNPRYMFKRLAGGIHLVSASTALVVIQVLVSSVDYTRTHLFYAYPDGAVLKYGYGTYLAWISFAVNIICGIMFLWYSGKKKGNKAATDELAMADECTIMGR